MTIFEIVSTIISVINLIADIFFRILGLKSGDKKK